MQKTIALYNWQGQRLLTLKEAEKKGYGSAYRLKKRLNRGLLPGYKIGHVKYPFFRHFVPS